MKIFSDISLWWIIPAIAASIGASIWYYRNQTQLADLNHWIKRLLIGLRSVALFLLVLVLFGILFETKDSKIEKPVFINLIDNSLSMMNYRDSSSIKKNVTNYLDAIGIDFKEEFDVVTYVVDRNARKENYSFKGEITDLSSGFDLIYNQYYNRNIGGICLISDGNYNKGQNPNFVAERIKLTPVFTLAVGDTLTKKDQILKSVSTNQVAFLGNQFPMEIDIEANDLVGKGSKVEVYREKQLVEAFEISYKDQVDFQHFTVLLEADKVGFVNYEVVIRSLADEASYSNNRRSVFVEVMDSRNRVLMISSAPHPDITAIKQVLETDDKLEVSSKLLSEWDGSLKDHQLVILHGIGELSRSTLPDVLRTSKVPVLFLIDNRATNSATKEFGIDLELPSGAKTDEVQGKGRDAFQLFEQSSSLQELLAFAPPLHVRFGKTETRSGDVLIHQRIGPVSKPDPLVFFGKNKNGKYGVVVGEGLWRWKLAEYARKKETPGFNDLVQKSTQYLLVRSSKDPFRITLPKRFNENENVIINAEFYNEAMQLITTPQVKFVLKDLNGKTINYEFSKQSSGYQLNVGKLKAGKYTWTASTEHNKKSFQKNGVFVVEDLNIESLTTSSDYGVLKQLSTGSNGGFHELKDYNKLLSELKNREDIVHITYEESAFHELIDLIWIFILLILVLSTEWFVRRYYGSY